MLHFSISTGEALVAYERTLAVKRVIHPQTIGQLATVDMPEAPRYVVAMTKALLNTPSCCILKGHAELFTASDLNSLRPDGKNRKLAAEAADLMIALPHFLEAYCKLDEAAITKLVGDFEVRCVMHVHQIKVSTRKTYKSLLHILGDVYTEAKTLDAELPVWSKLQPLQETPAATASSSRGLREVREDGKIPNAELARRGFVLGALLQQGGRGAIHKLASMDDTMTVSLEATDDGQENVHVNRVDLIKAWKLHKLEAEEAFHTNAFRRPTDNKDFKASMWKGLAKAAMASLFDASSEGDVKIVRKPEQQVIALKDFPVGKLQLVGITQSVDAQPMRKRAREDPAIDMGRCYDHDDQTFHLVAKRCLQFPEPTRTADTVHKQPEAFAPAYWATKQSYDSRQVNVTKEMKPVPVKFRSMTYTVSVPVLTNSKHIVSGDEIVALKSQADEREAEPEPDPKRQQTSGKGHGQSTSGGRGRGRGKGKTAGRK